MESHHHVQQRSDASLLHTFVAREKPGADNPARYIVGGSIACVSLLLSENGPFTDTEFFPFY